MSPFKNAAMGDVLEDRAYGVVLCDPAWQFLTYTGAGTPHRTEVDHYAVMSLDDLKALPVGDLAAKDCLLAMWVIGSHIDQAIELGRHWGFKYKTDGFVWVKIGKHDAAVRPISLGKWTRKQVEICLFFTRGAPPRLDAGIRQLIETDDHIIYAAKREHSRKPAEIHERLQRLAGGPYAELFARERRDGWASWGNEVGKFDLESPFTTDDPELAAMLGLSDSYRNMTEMDLIG